MLLAVLFTLSQTLLAQPGRFGLPACSAPDQELAARSSFVVCHSGSFRAPVWTAYELKAEHLTGPFDPALWSNCLFTETDHTLFENYAYYYVGVDLGQSQDFTAICVLEAAKVITGARNGWDFAYPTAMRYTIRHIERMPLGTPYDKIVNRVRFMLRHPSLGQYPKLVVDATGVGRAVVDLFKRADTGARIIPITLTGGEKPTRDGDSYNVPRSHLLASLEVAIQTGQIGICKDLPAAPLFLNELRSLRRSTNDTGAARVEPSSTRTHDDLVFAAALAYWKATSKL